MNKYIYTLLALVLFSSKINAQVQHEIITEGITIKGNGAYGANFLTNKQLSVFNNNVLNLATPIGNKEYNRLGLDLSSELLYVTKNKHDKSYIIGVGATTLVNASLSNDAANIAAYGNYNYQGKQAHLGQSYVQYYNMQYLKLGVVLKGKGCYPSETQLTANIYGIKNYAQANINYLNMYTTPYFTSISTQNNWNLTISDTSAKAKKTFNYSGAGAGLNLDMIVYGATKIYFGLRNVGGLWLNKNTINIQKQGAFNYDGITINGINDLKDTTLINTSINKLKDSLYSSSKTRYSTQLPWNMYVAFARSFSRRIDLHYGFNYQYSVGYKPMLFAQLNYYLTRNLQVGIVNTYGGYAGYGLGLNANIKLNKMSIYMGIKNILLLPTSKANAGVQAGINFKLSKD